MIIAITIFEFYEFSRLSEKSLCFLSTVQVIAVGNILHVSLYYYLHGCIYCCTFGWYLPGIFYYHIPYCMSTKRHTSWAHMSFVYVPSWT